MQVRYTNLVARGLPRRKTDTDNNRRLLYQQNINIDIRISREYHRTSNAKMKIVLTTTSQRDETPSQRGEFDETHMCA